MHLTKHPIFPEGLGILIIAILLWKTIPTTGAQSLILLDNPSFEDKPGIARPPAGWYFCGTAGETPPDVHPNPDFAIGQSPADKNTYIGLAARDNGTWEALGQRLANPLQAGHCYQFSIYACVPVEFMNTSRLTGAYTNFANPLSLRLSCPMQICDKSNYLAISPPVSNTQWRKYTFLFSPERDGQFFILEAYYADSGKPYNGYLLIDAASPIQEIDCETKEILSTPDTLQDDHVDDLAALRSYVMDHARQIHFGASGLFLERHYFVDEAGQEHQTNRPLWQIGHLLRQFPEAILEIAVSKEKYWDTNEKMKELEGILIEAGLPVNQVRIRPLKKRDFGKEWLWRESALRLLFDVNNT